MKAVEGKGFRWEKISQIFTVIRSLWQQCGEGTDRLEGPRVGRGDKNEDRSGEVLEGAGAVARRERNVHVSLVP